MALKFRRGTTAQKSGSLAFGEPYVNTTLGTLQIGGNAGDITLSSVGTGSNLQVGGISGSSLDITGNAKIDGNLTLGGQLTIGDATSDTVNVVASLSSSLIPQTTNAFDLGSATKIWKDLYISTGSIKFVAGTTVVKELSLATIAGLESATGSSDAKWVALGNQSASFARTDASNVFANDQTFSGSINLTGRVTAQLAVSASSLDLSKSDGNVSIKLHNSTTGRGFDLHSYDGESFSIHDPVSGRSTFRIDSGSSYHTHLFGDLYVSSGSIVAQNGITGPIIATNGVVSGSSQVIDILSSLNTYTGSNNTTNTTQNSRLDQLSTASGSAITRLTALEVETSNLETFSSSALTRITNLEGTDISITLTGDVTGTGTITNLGNVSFATTVAANSVALGTDTTGDYVASLVAGTGVTLSNNSGEGATPTIAIGQAVATSSSPTFAGLTINGAITATGDITAFFTSDKRHKNNIQIIPNALEKVSKLNGVTWEWNDDVNEVTKQSPKTGLIAQEVLEVLPEVVKQKEDGYLGLDYTKMIGLLVEAIKEQQSQIEELKSKLGYN